tara:strand:- start:64 stop:318 length:255 start_codon:yes stop_codon:yes gene_type:complete
MEKDALKMNNNTVTLAGDHKTILEYDINKDYNRGRFFNKIFTNYGYDEKLVADIDKQREAWLKANGDKNSYTFTPSIGGNLAMT